MCFKRMLTKKLEHLGILNFVKNDPKNNANLTLFLAQGILYKFIQFKFYFLTGCT